MKEVVVVSAVRTPFGKFGGQLRDYSAVDLGTMAVKAVMKKVDIDPKEVDELIMGVAVLAGFVGLLAGVIGGLVSNLVANLVYSPLSDLAMQQRGEGAAGAQDERIVQGEYLPTEKRRLFESSSPPV